MEPLALLDSRWADLHRLISGVVDLDQTARATRAFEKKGRIPSAEALFRLLMVYSTAGHSLDGTAAWASLAGVAEVSDVTVLTRLRYCRAWGREIVGQLLTAWGGMSEVPAAGQNRRFYLIDATTVRCPGPQGRCWRVHTSLAMGTNCLAHVDLSDDRGAEALSRFPLQRGDVAICDAGYARAGELHGAVAKGVDVLCRIGWKQVSLYTQEGPRFGVLEALRQTTASVVEFPVWLQDNQAKGHPRLGLRLIARRLEGEALERARQRVLRRAKRKGHVTQPETLEAAHWILVLTSLNSDQFSANDVLEIYRFRWQIEIYFKKIKQFMNFSVLKAKSEDLVVVCLCGRLIAAILVEHLREIVLSFSPSASGHAGSRLPGPRAAAAPSAHG